MKRRIVMTVLLVAFLTAALFAGGKTEAAEENKSLSIIMFSSFVTENDNTLRAMAEEFGRMKGISVSVDFVGIQEMYPKLTAEADSRSGHDIVGLENLQVSVYQNSLLPINEVIDGIVAKYGKFAPSSMDAGIRDGEWKALPWWIVPFNATYREDLFQAAGFGAPDTWDDLLRAGRTLKAQGHPVGLPFGSCGDANNSLYQILWAFGAGLADKDGKIILDSKETRDAIAFTRELYSQAMPNDVLGWADNGANNNFILSGTGSWTFNAISVWVTATTNNPDFAAKLNHHGALAGPAGRFGSGDFYSLGIWNFSPNKEIAKEFLAYLYDETQMNRYIASGKGFNLPTHPYYYDHPVFNHEKLQGIKGYADFFRLTGYPAPPDARAQAAYQQWIVPNLFHKTISGRVSVDQAIKEAVEELVEIGYKK